MKKLTLLIFFGLISVLTVASVAHSQTHYVNDIMEITLRAGPGLDYRIMRMLNSGQEFEVLEKEKKWTQVRLPDGTTGWVFSQYVTDQSPGSLSAEKLGEEIEPLRRKVESLTRENKRLIKRNQELAASLEETRKKLENLRKEHEALQEESSDFLELKKKYDAAEQTIEEKNQQIEALEKKLADSFMSSSVKWFLAGAGVLILGMILGRTRVSRKKRPSLR